MLLLGVLLTASSCVSSTVEPEVEKATLQISARSALLDPTDNPDEAITSLRMMVFRTGSYIMYNEKIDLANNNPFTIKIDKGTYDFVFIANEDSDESLHSGKTLTEVLDAYAGRSVSDITAEYFDSSAFRNDYSIPMTSIYRNVQVIDDRSINNNGTPVSGTWEVKVVRSGIRVDLFIVTENETMAEGFQKLEVVKVPKIAYLFDTSETTPAVNVTGASSFETYTASSAPSYRTYLYNEGDEKGPHAPEFEGDVTYELTPSDQVFVKDGDKWYWYKRIILPYTAFTPVGTGDNGIQLRVTVWGRPYTLTLSNQANTDYTIKRNSRYNVTGILNPSYIEFKVSVKPWGPNDNQEIIF